MTTATVDLDLLNELFENQKKLDDIFSFNDESFLSSSFSISDQKNNQDSGVFRSNEDWSHNADDTLFEQKSRSKTSFAALIVIEIAVIACGLIYFT
jgi:hypothetical protein